MGKCVYCEKETTAVAESIFTTEKQYLCSDCFNKEQNQGCLTTIIVFVVFIVIMVLILIFTKS